MKDLIFYTDGACSGNPGIGGWSYVELVKCDSGFKTSVTKGWLLNWYKNGWKTKEDKPIKNKQIWEKMFKLVYEKKMVINMVHIKGHNGDPLNELADRSAVEAKQELSED